MTRRERLERKLEKREEWAGKAHARSEARFNAAHAISDKIPMGQPILVGHHSEKRARGDIARIDGNLSKGVEEHKLATHHEQKARGLEAQLERTIFDDDPDAIERLEERIKMREESAKRMNEINKAWRKGGVEAVRAIAGDKIAEAAASTMKMAPWLRSPLSATGARAAIRNDRERIEMIKAKQARREKAAATLDGVLIEPIADSEWCRVTFPEKPANEVLEKLRTAGFSWNRGSWVGKREALPEGIGGV